MSWVKLFDESWKPTRDCFEFKLTLWREDAMFRRQQWSVELSNLVRRENAQPGDCPTERSLTIDIPVLGFETRDWRRLAGFELRSDAAWHERVEFCHEYGRIEETPLTAMEFDFSERVLGGSGEAAERDWVAHDFVLRVGALDGVEFPVELDAWVLPEAEYWRARAESAEELARFGEGPPNLQVLGTGIFAEGWLHLPPCDSPEEVGKRILREEVDLERMLEWDFQPASRQQQGHYIDEPAFGGQFHFRTEPRWERRRKKAGE